MVKIPVTDLMDEQPPLPAPAQREETSQTDKTATEAE